MGATRGVDCNVCIAGVVCDGDLLTLSSTSFLVASQPSMLECCANF